MEPKKIPERWFPRKFDICGVSHQIFHVSVVVAALIHYVGLLRGLDAVKGPNALACKVPGL